MLTVNKLKNLMTYYVLFSHNSNIRECFLTDEISYISEKYDLFFNRKPDKIPDLNHKLIINVINYSKYWNIQNIEKHKDYNKFLFTLYFTYNFYYNSNNINDLVSYYNEFFNTYDVISNNDLTRVLHENLRKLIKVSIKLHNILFRNIKIKELKFNANSK